MDMLRRIRTRRALHPGLKLTEVFKINPPASVAACITLQKREHDKPEPPLPSVSTSLTQL